MKHLTLITCLISAALCHGQETPTQKTAPDIIERAWDNDDTQDAQPLPKTPFVYGSIIISEQAFHSLLRENSSDRKPTNDAKKDKPVKLPPVIPAKHIPLCLPHGSYHNVAPIFKKWGVVVKKDAWILAQRTGHKFEIFYCITHFNSAVLKECVLYGHWRNAYLLDHRMTLVSIGDLSLTDKPWTINRLMKFNPKITMRAGTFCRSGSKSSTVIKTKKPFRITSLEVLSNRSNDEAIFSLEFNFKWSAPDLGVKLVQSAQIDGRLNQPTIVDCGIHGEKPRRYLLVIDSTGGWLKYTPNKRPLEPVQKIVGIYAMGNSKTAKAAKTAAPPNHATYRAHTHPTFLKHLKRTPIVQEHSAEAEDPFATTDPPEEDFPAPPRVTNYPVSKDLPADNIIYDITAHLKITGMSIRPKEWVYYNKTNQQLILHGSPTIIGRAEYWMKKTFTDPLSLRANFRIVEVDIPDLTPVTWTLPEIAKRNPKLILHNASQARSGEISRFGHTGNVSHRDSDGKKQITTFHEHSIAPILSENNRDIYLDFQLKNKQPIGKEKLRFENDGNPPLLDGKPRIIQLGHPSRGNRVYLLIVTGNIITPDGRFYRNRFQLIP